MIMYIICAIGAVFLGLGAGWILAGRRGAILGAQLDLAKEDNAALYQKAEALDARLQALLQENARLSTELTAERGAIAESKKQMSEHFESLSAKVAKESQESFLTLAEQSFKRLQEGAKADHEKSATMVKSIVEPVQKSLESIQGVVDEIEKKRFSELNQSLSLMHTVTMTLSNALRSPTARGKWGEIHLKRALEAVGMTEMVDFVQQDVLRNDDGIQKPDCIIQLPGNRSIVIDSKVPLDAFMDAAKDGISEDERRRHLARHAEQVRTQIKKLSSRAYWEKLPSPEFVLMYLPSDAHYAAALESDASLFEAGIENRVFLMTPSTLLPTLRVIEHAWKQEKLKESAQKISTLGQDLYKRLCVFGGHMEKLRRGLSAAIGGYDDAVGSLERSVMPAARKFHEMQGGAGDALPTLEKIGQAPRALNAPDAAGQDLEEKTGS